MRRAYADKGRHEIHILRLVRAVGQFATLLRLADDADAVAQPLDCRPGHEDRTFQWRA
jgi:hypothetical protein